MINVRVVPGLRVVREGGVKDAPFAVHFRPCQREVSVRTVNVLVGWHFGYVKAQQYVDLVAGIILRLIELIGQVEGCRKMLCGGKVRVLIDDCSGGGAPGMFVVSSA